MITTLITWLKYHPVVDAREKTASVALLEYNYGSVKAEGDPRTKTYDGSDFVHLLTKCDVVG